MGLDYLTYNLLNLNFLDYTVLSFKALVCKIEFRVQDK